MTARTGTSFLMLQQVNTIAAATFISAFFSSLLLTTTSSVLLLLFLVTPLLACPPSCECTNTTILEVSCKNGRLLSIFTQIDSATYSLSLDNVVDLQRIRKDLIQDLTASEIVRLQITSSSVQEIEENAFDKLVHLEELDLSRNELSTIHANSFAGLSDLKLLNLSHNHLTTLGQSLGHLTKLLTLDLSTNYLKVFPPDVFTSQNSLTTLKLDGNPLRSLQDISFQGLHSVRELRARDCSLIHVDDGIFLVLPALALIDLGKNRLSSIPLASVLSKLIILKSVYLDNNEIQALYEYAFNGVHLQTLDLSYNRISKIDPLAFNTAIVGDLDLSFNVITFFSSSALKQLGKHLTRLNLAGNPLRSLYTNIFEDLELLESLNVSSCSLEALEYDHLKSLPVLHMLDISHNSLHFLSQPVLDLFNKLDTLSLHENAWVCNYQIKFLRDWLKLTSSASKVQCPLNHEGHRDCTNMLCTCPADLQKNQIILLEDRELARCQHEKSSVLPASTQGAIVASCLGFAVVLLIVTIFLWRRGQTHKGLQRMCVPSPESSHVVDEDEKVPPLVNCDRHSLTLSDHNFVFRHYFDHLVTDPKLMADGENEEDGEDEPGTHKEGDSLYSSQPSLYSHHSDAGYGMESTV